MDGEIQGENRLNRGRSMGFEVFPWSSRLQAAGAFKCGTPNNGRKNDLTGPSFSPENAITIVTEVINLGDFHAEFFEPAELVDAHANEHPN